MTGERSYPDAPLEHADERAHRRLIAQRANRIGYEQGLWTPTFDFATTGDLSNSYAAQEGYYWRLGPLVHFAFYLQLTPTHTTAAGAARIFGVPYAAAGDSGTTSEMPGAMPSALRMGGTGITWPLNDVVLFIRDTENWFEIAFQGTGSTGQTMVAADHTSATAMLFYGTGFYPLTQL